MAITGGIMAVGSAAMGIMGGMQTKDAAGKAAEAQQRYLAPAMEFQKGVYSDAGTNMQPWISTGQQAVDALGQFSGLPGHGGAAGSGALASYKQFEQTPYYTFPLAQTQATMDRAAAGKGLSLSSGEVQSLGKAAGGYAASNFGTYITALQNLSGLGATSSANLGNIGASVGQNVNQVASGQAATAGAGIMGQAAGQRQIMGGIGDLFKGIGGMAGGFDAATGSSYANSPMANIGAQNVGNYSIPGTGYVGPYGPIFGNPAPGTAGGFNNGLDLVNPGGGVVTPPIPPGGFYSS